MSFDAVAFASSAARNGLVAVPVNSGEDHYSYSTNDLYPLADGGILAVVVITEAIANCAEWRLHRKKDPNWNRAEGFMRDQTGAPDLNNLILFNDPITMGDTLTAEVDNGNNAQLETVLVLLYKATVPRITLAPPEMLPPKTTLVHVSGAQTLVADVWTNAALTFTDYNLDRDKRYKILGAMFHSATGHAWRLSYKEGPNKEDHPGFVCGDTTIVNFMLYGDLGSFSGKNPPSVEFIASAGDTAQEGVLLLQEL